MERNVQKIGLVNLIVLLLVSGGGAFLAFYANTLSGQTGLVFLGLGFLVVLISYFQMRLEETERIEKLEFEEVTKSAASGSLFNTAESEVFPAKRSREQFERFFVPAFTVLLLLLEGGAVFWFWKRLESITLTPIRQPAVAMSLFGVFALALFLLGKYASGISRLESVRLLRPQASYLLLGAYICFIAAVSVAAVQLGFPRFDLYAARVLTVLLGLIGLETAINLVFEIYRPRVRGKTGRLLYDSRLAGLMGQPEGLFSTAAQALDYQFGFKVSDTWVYRFLEKALAWIVLVQLLLLWISTAFVFVSPGEQALIERFGRPLADRPILEPGLHMKRPWPIDTVYRAKTREIQTFNVGFEPETGTEKEKTILWTVSHYKTEFNLLVASRDPSASLSRTNSTGSDKGAPVDLLTVSIPVQYQIKDLRAWTYNHTDAGKLLEKLANREVVRYLVGVDIMNIMSSGRDQAATELRDRIQKRADELNLGVNVVFVGLQDIHPPVKVAKKFEEVNAALQENEAELREAEGYSNQVVLTAKGSYDRKIHEAEGYSNLVVFSSRARAGQFANKIAAFQASPSVFSQRSYLTALGRGATNARKYIITTTNTHEVLQFDLQDKIRPDLLDSYLPSSKK